MTDFANYLILLIDDELKRWGNIKERPSQLVLSTSDDNTQSFLFIEFKEAQNAFNVLERVRDGIEDMIDAEKRMLDYFPNLRKLEDPFCEDVNVFVKKATKHIEDLYRTSLVNERLIYFEGDLRLMIKSLIQSAERKLDVTHINGRDEIQRIRTPKKFLISALELLKEKYCLTDSEVALFQSFVNYYNLEVRLEETEKLTV